MPSIVFVHGIWADGSCFAKVIPPLRAAGYEVVTSQHSLDSLAGDVETVVRTIGRVTPRSCWSATPTVEH